MLSLQYPDYAFRSREVEGKRQIFDIHRKRWIVLTPEEWVRQNFLQYLLQVKNYPSTLIAVEKEMKLGELSRRFDILVYDRNHQPWLMVECKSMEVPLNDDVLHQLLRYNISIPVTYLVITNGTGTFVFERKEGKLERMTGLPDWE
ncbi:type I restriction enzyme HsdR N-terminal domain-containing protein [Flavihumibacter stibioxidans]|uniref:Restriction endonuclease subunit R n=1 Tax=Flavihumibacter stibioxidans TaxID=1834163 RepID=A0ABR7M5F2_9BACT|nr:type I restriction enzyme HsdR N-terminal domain-containing protein [Flavihumibacter stibioxidans]MBC6490207.1 restriction endonuclease subunit R [Flavihumibacter stibioxidans]